MCVIAIFIPLFSAILVGFWGKKMGATFANAISCVCMAISTLFMIKIFRLATSFEEPHVVKILSWINSGSLHADWAIRIDMLSAVMLLTVSIVSFMVHVYSVGYMHHDKARIRFMSYLSLFTFLMYMLVTADNLLQLFFGWEGVGLASYLLIGFWHEKLSARKAAIKAFVVNRIGDVGFVMAICLIYFTFNTINIEEIIKLSHKLKGDSFVLLGHSFNSINFICMLLLLGAMGKSAQIGLHVWLPDAMEGPTPVSALIHAATMVTAGIFLIARMSPLFELAPYAMNMVCFVGATTALFAALVACTQDDIKKVIAYSTCSQLGYMFIALGVGAYQAAIFHLFTHAFFKALLFLGAGSVIHAMSNEQDMRKMGGIWKNIKWTYALMWIGSLALIGMPVFAGYYSKDFIVEATYASNIPAAKYAFNIAVAGVFLTAFYSLRLMILTFHGEAKADDKVMAMVKESAPVMIVPLIVLAVGAVFSGMWGHDYFIGHEAAGFWKKSVSFVSFNKLSAKVHSIPHDVKYLPMIFAFSGMALGAAIYALWQDIPHSIATKFSNIYALIKNKFYFDELYRLIIVAPLFKLAEFLWKIVDIKIIDNCGPNALAKLVKIGASKVSAMECGYIYVYALSIVFGLLLMLSAYILFLVG